MEKEISKLIKELKADNKEQEICLGSSFSELQKDWSKDKLEHEQDTLMSEIYVRMQVIEKLRKIIENDKK